MYRHTSQGNTINWFVGRSLIYLLFRSLPEIVSSVHAYQNLGSFLLFLSSLNLIALILINEVNELIKARELNKRRERKEKGHETNPWVTMIPDNLIIRPFPTAIGLSSRHNWSIFRRYYPRFIGFLSWVTARQDKTPVRRVTIRR